MSEPTTAPTTTRADAAATAGRPGSPADAKRRRDGRPRPRYGTHVVLLIGGLLMVFPFLWQIIMSLSTHAEVTSVPPTWIPAEPQWGNYPAVFEQIPFLNQFLNTAAVTVLRVVGQLILCAMAGYAFARMEFRGKNVLFALVLSILMVPYQIYLIPQYGIIQQLGWLNTVAGIAAPGIFSAFGTFLMRQHFMGMPRSLEEAARLDGASPWQTFWRIMFPLSGSALSAVAILTALASWNDLMWPLIVATYDDRTTLAVGLSTLQGQFTSNYPVMMAASFMAMLPLMILFIVLQRRVVEGLAHSGMKG
ncbi:multiple sugar transport system permease protein [Brachybacterium muris]|uniref:carbohydrate ABC transporter permease n=1 Tax=Brachybacterium muris TaxID=219301 RepID=UPI00195EA4AD|nr:carbohydrate ABC transporter permease [Brachybacterium muris]MBM7499427.1 multiple sugar transport system permease protein [Brachybacterium muris]MCT2295505.1 carbohydrate ABC transporter permease [Brachybacterium muris]